MTWMKMISETGDEEHRMQCFEVLLQKELGFSEETMKVMEWRVRWAVEARRKGSEEQEQRRQAEQWQNAGQEQSTQGKQVRFDG